MNTNGRTSNAERLNVAASVSEMAGDAVELAELQAKLLACDLKASAQNARTSLVLAIVGLCTLLSSVPIALMALAEVLVDQLNWSPAAGYAMAAVVGLLVSALAIGVSYVRFQKGLLSLERSREEMNRNIEWLKAQLSRSGKRTRLVSTL